MFEHFEDRHENVGTISQDSKSFFRTTPEDPVDTAGSEPINEVLSESERYEFRNRKTFALRERRGFSDHRASERDREIDLAHLLESDTEIDVNEFSS